MSISDLQRLIAQGYKNLESLGYRPNGEFNEHGFPVYSISNGENMTLVHFSIQGSHVQLDTNFRLTLTHTVVPLEEKRHV